MTSRSEAAKLRWQNPEYRAKHVGAKRTEATRRLQSQAKKSHWANPAYRDKMASSALARCTPEVRKSLAEAKIRNWQDEDYRSLMLVLAERKRTSHHVHSDGYLILHGMSGHPLADKRGNLYEHRKVLWDKVGPEPPLCHWCGMQLVWRGSRDVVVCVDHLDENVTNNDPGNLVPSCFKDNWDRGLLSHLISRRPTFLMTRQTDSTPCTLD